MKCPECQHPIFPLKVTLISRWTPIQCSWCDIFLIRKISIERGFVLGLMVFAPIVFFMPHPWTNPAAYIWVAICMFIDACTALPEQVAAPDYGHIGDGRFLKVYFWFLVALLGVGITWSLNSVADVGMNFLGLTALYGYAFHKKILSQAFWRIAAIAYVLWSVSFIVDAGVDWRASLVILIIMAPQYWSALMYPWETLERDPQRKERFVLRRTAVLNRRMPIVYLLYILINVVPLLILYFIFLSLQREGPPAGRLFFFGAWIYIVFPFFLQFRIGFRRAWQMQCIFLLAGIILLTLFDG